MIGFYANTIKFSVKGAITKLIKRHTGVFQHQRKWLKGTEFLDAAKLKEVQLRLLKRIVCHAYETVPYYGNLMRQIDITPDDIKELNDITLFPIMTKTDMRAAGDKLLSRKFNRWFLSWAYTGGTTGVRLPLKRDLKSVSYEHAFVRRQLEWAGVGLNDRTAWLTWRVITNPNKVPPKPYVYDLAMKELILSAFHLTEQTAPRYLEAISHYKIKALISYPSAAFTLAKACISHNVSLPIKCVLTTSETLDPLKADVISKAFNCSIFDYYGSSERVCYIHTCEHGSYHIVPEYGLTELMPAGPPNDDCFRIVATGFWNMAQPLIRYDTGDLVKKSTRVCSCGRQFPVVESIVGRDGNILTSPSGRILGAVALECMMENILFEMQGLHVFEAQMILEEGDVMVLEYVPSENFCPHEEEAIGSILKKHLPSEFKASIRRVNRISRTASGKFVSFVIEDKTTCGS